MQVTDTELSNLEWRVVEAAVAWFKDDSFMSKDTIGSLTSSIEALITAREAAGSPETPSSDWRDEFGRILSPETKLEDVSLSARLQNVCYKAGILTLADLAARSELELLGRRNCGKRTLREARELLVQIGREFAVYEGFRFDRSEYVKPPLSR